MQSKQRHRVTTENCGNLPYKRQKLDSDHSEREYTAPSTQSKCITPVNLILQAVPDITIINTNTEKSCGVNNTAATIKQTSNKNELMSEMLGILIDEYNCNHQ